MRKLLLITLFSILVPALLFSLVGCMKPPSTEIDRGTPVDCKVLDKAVDNLSVVKVSKIEAGELAFREATVAFDVFPPELMGTIDYAVTTKVDMGTYYELNLFESIKEKVDGHFKASKPYLKNL